MADSRPVVMHELAERTKLEFAGPQALWFLHQLITNHVENLEPGEGSEALLLTPKGRINAVLRVLCTPRGVLADFDGGRRQELHDFFANRVFATRVKVADVTGEFTILRLLGTGAFLAVAEALELSEPLPARPHANLSVGSALVVVLAPPLVGLDLWLGPRRREEIPELLSARGIRTLSGDEYRAMRVQAGSPEFEPDLAAGLLPQEAALERAVHFEKGCYLGQESVAMAQRGRVRRRLRHLEFSTTPQTGEAVFEDQPAGTVTSVDDAGYGMGVIRTTVPLEAEIKVGAARARVKEVPGTLAGPSVPSARELRERLKGGS